MGTFVLYPNFYIILVAGSGLHRKSTAINQVEGILQQMSPAPNLIAQKVTPEALIEALSGVNTNDPKKFLSVQSTGYLVVDELSMFLNRKSYEAGLAPVLIQLYDCKKVVKYHTKGRGVESILDACFGILAGSTIEWIRNAIPEDAVGGGLTSRIIFVSAKDTCPPVAFPTLNDEKRSIKEGLVRQLQGITELKGPFKLTESAKKFFEVEYIRFRNESPFFADRNLSGYGSRRGDHLLKISMIFAAAELSMLVDENHLIGAKALLEGVEVSMPHVLTLITSTELGSLLTTVSDLLKAKKDSKGRFIAVARSEVLRKLNHRINSKELSDIMDTLAQSGLAENSSDGKDITYRWIGQHDL